MTAALAIGGFRSLDTDNDGVINSHDLISAFASVAGVGYEEAVEATKLIITQADKANAERDGKITFVELISVLSQDMMSFDQFLEYMASRNALGYKAPKGVNVRMSKEEFEKIRASAYPEKKWSDGSLPAPTKLPALNA